MLINSNIMKLFALPGMLKYLIFLCVIMSCKGLNQKSYDAKSKASANYGLNYEFMKSKINESINNSTRITCDFKTIKKQTLDDMKLGIIAIPIAEKRIKKCIGSMSEADKDSLYILFNEVFYTTAIALTDSLETKYTPVIKKIRNKIHDSEVKQFISCLDLCGIDLLVTEGNYYLDVKYDYFYHLFKGKVSSSLDDFLKIRSRELKQGFSEDAFLLISFNELYGRVVDWENFKSKYPKFFMNDVAEYYYNVYLSTFLSGMSNSPTFDQEQDRLSPTVKKLYEKIIARNDSRRSTKVISEFYALLKTTDFKMPANLNQFLKDRGLSTMIAVQPDTR